jgi:uncharacterized protein (TIGR03435 family)
MAPLPRTLLYALLVIGTGPFLRGQTLLLPKPNTPLPAFEVATIKPTAAPYIGIYTKQGGRISAGHCTVLCIAREAFHAPDFEIVGLPAWVRSTEFDVEAVPPDDSPARQYNPPGINSAKTDDQRLMLQALLRDRFGFKYHVAKTEQPVFFLELSGKPLKLNSPKDPKASPFMSVNMYSGGEGNGEVEGDNTTMSFTAFRLSTILGRTVIDETGLTGAYDFHVDAPDAKDADMTNATLEGLKTLGLKLRAGKAPVDAIIVDEVSHPTPN